MTLKRKLIVIILGVVSVLALSLFGAGCSKSSPDTSSASTYNGEVYTLTIIFDELGITKQVQIYEDENEGNTLNYSSYTNTKGYDFLGYYTAEGVQYFDENGNQCQYIIESDMVLYARFAAKNYTFKYMYDEDGDGIYETTYYTQSVTYGSTFVSFITAPSKTGYDFVGWAASATGSTYYSEGTTPNSSTFNEASYNINSDDEVVLYARYKVKSMTVTLVYTNTTYSDITLTVDYGSYLPDLSQYYIDTGDKVAVGWSQSPYGNYEKTDAVTMDVTLYAVWQEYKFITLYYTDTDVEYYQIYNDTTVSITLPTDVERAGYTFDGWYASSIYSGNPTTSQAYALFADTYYAKWTLTTYTLTFEYDGEYFAPITYTIESGTITLPVIEKEGYNFYGWCTNASLNGSVLTQITAGTTTGKYYGDYTLYPKIEKYSTTINYYYGNTRVGILVVEYGDTFTLNLPTNITNGEEFYYYYYTDSAGNEVILTDSSGVSLEAWTSTATSCRALAKTGYTTYTITFVYDGEQFEDITYTIESDVITLPVLDVTGYDFSGWYTDSSLTGTALTQIVPGTDYGDFTLYPGLTKKTTQLSLYVDTTYIAESSAAYGESYTIAVPAAEELGYGRAFEYWYYIDGAGDKVILTDREGAGLDIWSYEDAAFSLYAEYSYITYTITFVYERETFDPVTYTVQSSAITLPMPEVTGYNFLGWCTDEALTSTPVTQIVPGSYEGGYGDYTLYASFELKTSTLNYYIESTLIGTTTVTYGESYTIAEPTAEELGNGRAFEYWYMTLNGVEVVLTGSDGAGLAEWAYEDASYTVYAKFSYIEYTITFVYDRETFDPVTYTVQSSTITLPSPEVTGYNFLGWCTDEALTSTPITKIVPSSYDESGYGDYTLYASFELKTTTVKSYIDSTLIATTTVTYSESYTITAPTAVQLGAGKTFDYWYITVSGTEIALTDIDGASLAVWAYEDTSLNVYAHYTCTEYTISFVYDAQTIDDVIYTVTSSTIYLPEITKTGYNFLGWCTDSSLTSTVITKIVPGSYEGGYGDYTLYPKFELKTTVLTYYFDGTQLGTVTVTYSESYTITIPSSTVLGEDKIFKYWYASIEGNDTQLTDAYGSSLTEWAYEDTALAVFASYEQLYTVTYTYTNPTTLLETTVTTDYMHAGDTYTVTAYSYTNFDYLGLYIDGTLISSDYTYIYTVADASVTITAKYMIREATEFNEKYNFVSTAYCYNSHYYALVRTSKTWSAAESYCEFYGGHLVTITTNGEQTWIAALLDYLDPGVYSYHIGGYYSNSAWHWVTGETFYYSNWHTGEPSSSSENYIGFYSSYTDYTWNDGSGGAAYFIIEWDSLNSYIDTESYSGTDMNGDSVSLTLYEYNGHYYTVVDTSMLWTTAETYAEYLGGYLAVITSSAENSFVGSLLTYTSAGSSVYWIGGNDYETEGTWVWVTGETWYYTNWDSGQPDNYSSAQDYATISYSSYIWDDDTNTTSRPFVIEWSSLDAVGTFTPLYSIRYVSTESEFTAIQNNTSGYYILTDDITLTSSWTPVNFSGILIGNGHTVSGITVNQSSGNAGVFLTVTGTIENVTFDVTVNSTSTSTVYVGGAVAYLSGGTLKNITVKGTVTSASTTAYTGGVLGYLSTGTVSGLTNYATVNGSATGTGTTGGVIGRTDIFGVSNLVNYGEVTGYYDVGGVIGYIHVYNSAATETAQSLINYGTVTSVSSGNGSTGGVIGVIYRSLGNTTSYSFTLDLAQNYGNVSATHTAGGIIGYLYLYNSNSSGTFVFTGKDFYNQGNVISTGYNVGGLVGYGYASSTSSYISGTSSAMVSGTYYVGGIAGYLQYISLEKCSNAGSTVTASGYTNDGTGDCVGLGGYVGYGYDITISNCSNAVAITYTGGTYKYVGGIAGYLRGSINNCSNTAAISSTGYEVGGVVGTFAISGTTSVYTVKNSGAVSGTYYVGGVFGEIWWDNSTAANITLTVSEITNSGDVTASAYSAGGVVGHIYLNNKNSSYTMTMYATGFVNTGDVTGTYQVGGVVGYGYTESSDSYITASSSSGAVTGTYYVGGIAGFLEHISLTDSSNTGASVTATSYSSSSYVHLGGYVGCGYIVSGCDNAVDITYNYTAYYVGGIAGSITGTISNCTNSGNITTSAYCVGGIAGQVYCSSTTTLSGLTNTGAVSGVYHVGGVFGECYYSSSMSYTLTLTLSNLTNSGIITASSYRAGGISGYFYLYNSNSSYTYVLHATGLENTGDVTGTYQVGGIVGYGYAESTDSYITTSSSSGAVTGTYYVGGLAGYLNNISLTDSDNTGASVAATSFDSNAYVYLGGYVGYGYCVSGLKNAVNITYTYSANYIGGVAGHLTGTISDCSNSGTIKAASASRVGGVVGVVVYGVSGTTTMSNLSNTGDVTGGSYVGGIFGELYYSASISGEITLALSTFTNSGDITASDVYAGGIIGNAYLKNTNSSYTYVLDATGLVNTGDVTNTSSHSGGLIGYGYTESSSSYITASSSSGAITGAYYVGGLAGHLENISLTNSSNAGSTVTATSFDSSAYVYLGGYVGCGYCVSGCDNAVSITYNYAALYIGGIAGYLTGTVSSCTNSGNITAANASRMGGIVGRLTYAASGAVSMSNLTNTGDIVGAEYVGGIFGRMYYSASVSYNTTLSLTTITNSGNITISGSYAGGIAGHIYLKNTNSSYTYSLYASGITNTGAITAADYCYGIFGGGEIETASTVSDYTSTGTITCEGTYYGETYTGSNITFS